MEKWYVAKTKAGKERIVKAFLSENMGLEVFMPVIRHPQKSSMEGLFPTYLFCYVDPQMNDWGAVRFAPGISYFLGNGTELVSVPQPVIEHLKERVTQWNQQAFKPAFVPGQKVTISNGPFAGLDAIFEKYIPSRGRCQVLLEIMGRLSRAEIATEALGLQLV